MSDLDCLPPPAWDLVELDSYRDMWLQAHDYFSLNLVSSRGCPYQCNWCARPIHGTGYHSHSPKRVAEEMHFLKTELKADHVWFADDIFALSASWSRCLAEEVEKLGAQIDFKMQSRCDLMTRDTVSALRRAGCTEVWMGAESGSQRILHAMDKGVCLEDIYNACVILRQHGIRACYFLQFGYPGEKWEDIQQTIRMIRETQPDDVGISVSYPLPGTAFHRRVAAEMGAKQNWTDSDDLAMMFQGTYHNDFYRALHDAIHCEVDFYHGRNGNGHDEERLRELWTRVVELEKSSHTIHSH
jgi:radical SAM superfamily enzyme YgiQ (UPF0313 family)